MSTPTYFPCTQDALAHLCARDKRLGEAIQRIGPVQREVEPDLFAALVNAIVGQQISTKAQVTIWNRMKAAMGAVTSEAVAALGPDEMQRFGISMRKAGYICGAAEEILAGRLDLAALEKCTDDEVCKRLSALHGIGVWTAEMLLTFSMQRPDVVSFGDLAIHRGMRMLYRHRAITPQLFAKYKKRYSPYGSTASLYLWAIAGGALPELSDPAPKT